MKNRAEHEDIEIFSTCPPSNGADPKEYVRHVADVARWSEQAGCRGILVYADNSQVDPWLLCQVILENTRLLAPLVAVQPVYMHPYTVAKMVASFAYLHGRRLYLNMVAGGFRNDLHALGDQTPHDRRYDRLIEYTRIIKLLLEGADPVNFDGEFYQVQGLRLAPPLPKKLLPGIFLSGSSAAGLAAAKALRATAVRYPDPTGDRGEGLHDERIAFGVRVGVICRSAERDAWRVAQRRFPEDRRGQLAHRLATKVSDSAWHKQLSAAAESNAPRPYWLAPFKNSKCMCPYLVGSYDRVGEELANYLATGHRTFILDVPQSLEELRHINTAFRRALEVAVA